MSKSQLNKKKSVIFADKPILLNLDELQANGDFIDDEYFQMPETKQMDRTGLPKPILKK